MGTQAFCPECDGNTYLGRIGVDERVCPTCEGKGLIKPTVVVVFRRFRDSRDILALFPLIPETKLGECLSYQSLGQHGVANYALCMRATTRVSVFESDVQALHAELTGLGYVLEIHTRAPFWTKIAESRKALGL